MDPTVVAENLTPQKEKRSIGGPTFAFFLLLLVVSAALRAPGWVVPVFNPDEAFIAVQAEVVNNGGRLYEDAVDRKPPLVPYLYAVTFRILNTTGLWSVRLIAAIVVALTGWLLALEAHRRWGTRAKWLAGLLFVMGTVAFTPQDGQAANFEIFMLLPMTAGVVLAARGRPGSSGIAIAVATLCKQTGAAALLPIMYLAQRRLGFKGLLLAIVGFTAPLLIVASLVGPGDLLFWAVLGNGSYVGIDSASLYIIGNFLVMTGAFAVYQAPLLWWMPRSWRDRERRRAERDLWLWLASSAVAVLFGFRFFGHYYLQLLPPLVLLAAGSLATASEQAMRRTLSLATIIALSLSLLGFWVKPFDENPRYLSVSEYLIKHTGANDQILVWGSMPEIYWASGKLPATRFLTTGFLTGHAGGRVSTPQTLKEATPGAWRLFMGDFKENPPEYVLDTSPTAKRGSELYPMSRFPELARIIKSQYKFVESIDKIAVYHRK